VTGIINAPTEVFPGQMRFAAPHLAQRRLPARRARLEQTSICIRGPSKIGLEIAASSRSGKAATCSIVPFLIDAFASPPS
jgi:hypothetical protein